MKNLFLIFSFFAFIFVSNINAQIYDPVKWTSSSKQISDDEFELHGLPILSQVGIFIANI
ncbi:MAG: hypothetical protein IPL69_19340 [Saprospiraceae bacterium]|nr:hypothetical protein [Candidatus Brachybacter algidus]